MRLHIPLTGSFVNNIQTNKYEPGVLFFGSESDKIFFVVQVGAVSLKTSEGDLDMIR
jgi:hypothetical protein